MSPSGPEPADDPRIPTEEELATLPRWACVAFAARCARRVQPLYKHFWPDAPAKHVEALDKVITLAQASAADPASTSEAELRAVHAAAHAAAATYSAHAHAADAAASDAAAAHAVAAYSAADAAARAAVAAYSAAVAVYAAATRAAAAADAAHSAAHSADTAPYVFAHASRAIRRDYEQLKAAAKAEQWSDDTPVPPAFFGPLWPDGEPSGWPGQEVETLQLNSDIPSASELAALPLWASVALAVRCARRVLPLHGEFWPDAPKGLEAELGQMLTLAEDAAAMPASRDQGTLRAASETTFTLASNANAQNNNVESVTYAVARAVSAATFENAAEVYSAISAAEAAAQESRRSVLHQADGGGDLNMPMRESFGSAFRSAVRRDYELLKTAAKAEQWTDDTPVPPAFFGPLWPDGEPEGWLKKKLHLKVERVDPPIERVDPPADAPALSLYFDASEFDSETIALIISGLSELYREIGGDELIIDDVCVMNYSAVPEEIC
ncbi:MAG: hypothetical protein KF757_07395 [Phycisphaeraceae bacterium]|nr:hypothetical protein [Phycisphaeraceae bacterium]